MTRSLILALLAMSLGSMAPARGQTSSPWKQVLILYDAPAGAAAASRLNAWAMYTLLAHFRADAEIRPINAYRSGDVQRYDRTIYLGTIYDHALPSEWLADLAAPHPDVMWCGMNLWQLAWLPNGSPDPAFATRFGFRLDSVDDTRKYTRVVYKETTLTRPSESSGIGCTSIVDAERAASLATISTANLSRLFPYVVRGDSLWYVADIPFDSMTRTDRMLAIADLLHDFLDEDHPVRHPAFIRMEDVSPAVTASNLRGQADVYAQLEAPFAISLIPEYHDPTGSENGGIPQHLTLADAPEIVDAIRYMEARGGEVIQHGVTHQYGDLFNPYNGVTGMDYEFYRVAFNSDGEEYLVGPVPEDSEQWAYDRVLRGRQQLLALGWNPTIWLTPHYVASQADLTGIGRTYQAAVCRGLYLDQDPEGPLEILLMITPYPVRRDAQGIGRIPETCDYYNPDGTGADKATVNTLINRAKAMLCVRDGWASLFYHWFFGKNPLTNLITGIKALGYTFIRPSDTVANGTPVLP